MPSTMTNSAPASVVHLVALVAALGMFVAAGVSLQNGLQLKDLSIAWLLASGPWLKDESSRSRIDLVSRNEETLGKRTNSLLLECSRSTEELFRSDEKALYGRYATIRTTIDYDYHTHYTQSRQGFQDSVVDSMLQSTRIVDNHGCTCSEPTRPWIVFTAGSMGAGKTHVVKELDRAGRFPLHAYVQVDPDHIRHSFLPEFSGYVEQCPAVAGERTRKEAGMISEILTQAALHRGQNVLVDGTLREAEWYRQYFRYLREQFPNLRIAILHITAPRHAVFERAESRAKITGRVVPRELLQQTMQQVPKSIVALRQDVDFLAELYNTGAHEVDIVTDNLDWNTFRNTWTQTCSPTNA